MAARLMHFVLVGALAASCKPRHDPYAVTPLAPGGPAADAATGVIDPAHPRVVAAAPRDAGNVVRFREIDGGAPQRALGVDFGITREALAQRNTVAGVTCRDADEYVFCPRALVNLPIASVVVTYEFCGPSLCAVALDGTRTRDEALMVREFDALATMLQGELGAASVAIRRTGSGCSGHLPLCLTSRQAEYSARWTWRGGPQVSLSVDALEDDALVAQVAVAWLTRERVTWDAGPAPPHPLLLARRDAGVDAARQ